MSDIKTIASMLKEIAAAYPAWKADEDTIKVWTVYLVDMPDDLLVTAVRKFISSSGHAFAPSIPEIRAMAADIKRQTAGIPTAYEAWEDLLAAGSGVKRRLTEGNEIVHENYTFKHPMVKHVAEQLGWPARFPGGTDQEMADRSHFIKAYDQAVGAMIKAETQLTQVTNYIAANKMMALAEGMRR
jgi:hypothetical protein